MSCRVPKSYEFVNPWDFESNASTSSAIRPPVHLLIVNYSIRRYFVIEKLNFRTAAYAIALKKLRKFHDAVGMFS